MKKKKVIDIPTRKAVIVGLGGIGSWLAQGLCPFLNYQTDAHWVVSLVDGDEYEEKNRTRQLFSKLGPKAEIQAAWVHGTFPNLMVQAYSKFVSVDGANETVAAGEIIHNGDIVFSCVDNHKTRKLLASHCESLDFSTLISGGNEYTDGNVQLFFRSKGENLTCTLSKYHPEIAKPKDKAPFEMSCEEAMQSSPQLIFANMTCAAIMLNVFYNLTNYFSQPEVYFDILNSKVTPRERKK